MEIDENIMSAFANSVTQTKFKIFLHVFIENNELRESNLEILKKCSKSQMYRYDVMLKIRRNQRKKMADFRKKIENSKSNENV